MRSPPRQLASPNPAPTQPLLLTGTEAALTLNLWLPAIAGAESQALMRGLRDEALRHGARLATVQLNGRRADTPESHPTPRTE